MPAPALPWRRVAFVLVLVGLLIADVVALSHRFLQVEAHAAVPVTPNDPGKVERRAGWAHLQWSFVGRNGVDAPQAWGNLVAAGAAGGAGVTVAVLDTGVAYPSDRSSHRASPDLTRSRFVAGYDFVDDDPFPFDENGHGTHVASTIVEQTDNGYGLTGLAYGVRLMPVRVLDRTGDGDATTIARGVRFAASHGAKVINLSLNFNLRVTEREISDLLSAIDDAYQRGSLVVAGAGNAGGRSVSYPALGRHVVAVGATTEHGCLARYSNHGTGLDLVAPGGGNDANIVGDPACQPSRSGPPIYQITLRGRSPDRFGITGFIGTSMAAPHVAAVGALVVASGVIGADPSPAAIEARLERTARDLGAPGRDPRYGWGLVDAAAATSPTANERRPEAAG